MIHLSYMEYRKALREIDEKIIDFTRSIYIPASRFAIFLVFFWFGILKVIGESPASPLVLSLLGETLPSISPELFMVCFGVFEMIIGISFIIPRLQRFAIALLAIHMLTTVMPLFILRSLTWQGVFIPTLEGQYIIKNILIIALAIGIAAHLRRRHI